eukprot:Ihof_evm2s17 gene=Ihof_evmTU2s17
MTTLSKEEYLKRYISGPPDDDQKKKKKRRKKVSGASIKGVTVKIHVDDDAPPLPSNDIVSDDGVENVDEEAPLVAEVQDDRPIRGHSPSRWKKIEDSPSAPSRSTLRRQRHDSPDMSPPRRRDKYIDLFVIGYDDQDLSPPRRRSGSADLSPPRRSKAAEAGDLSSTGKMTNGIVKMADGTRAGLVTANLLGEESRKKKQLEDLKFKSMDHTLLGKGAATTVRDKQTGKRVDMKLERLKKKEEEAKMMEEEEHRLRWGKGAVQEQAKQTKMEEDILEMSKPFARGRDDADLDQYLRNIDRAGDPMAHLVKKKVKSNRPVYRGRVLPNRFNILPGYRWDGV